MRNRRFPLWTILASALLASGAWAAPHGGAGRPARTPAPAIADYLPQLDGPVSTVAGPDGRLWAAWSYRSSGEYDIAIVSRAPEGLWSAPAFYGRRDGADEVDPALAVDGAGTLYLVFATRDPGGLALATFAPSTGTWSAPTRLSADRTAASPAIRTVGDRVAVAWSTGGGVILVDLPQVPAGATLRGIQDGPDSVDPLGVSGPSGGGGGGSGVGMPPGGNGGNSGGDGHDHK